MYFTLKAEYSLYDLPLALKYFFPLIILCSIPVFVGDINPWGRIYGVIYIPLVKGLVSLLLGVYLYLIEDWYNTFFNFSKNIINLFFCYIWGHCNSYSFGNKVIS